MHSSSFILIFAEGPATVADNFRRLKRFQLVQGTISGLLDRQAFIMLDIGVLGRLDISQVSHHFVDPEEFVSCFDLGDRIKQGHVVDGIVANTTKYGAFVRLSKSQTGLLHISQISHDRVREIAAILKPGDRLKVMVMALNPAKNWITLTTKKLEATPGDFLRDPQLVFDNAEKAAESFRTRLHRAMKKRQGQL